VGREIDAEIRLLRADELDEAMLLSTTAGWNQRLADWRMLRQIAPQGSFTAIADGRLVGTAIGIDYGRFGWIAMMLVDPACRGRGLGARLLEAAMGAVPSSRPIRLDATPLGRPLYQRYGFEDESMLTRHIAEASRHPIQTSSRCGTKVRRLAASDLEKVTAADEWVFGGNRRVLFEWVLENAARYAHVIDTDLGPQYCFGRQGRLFNQIGPVVADNDEDARALMTTTLLCAESEAVVADVFDERDAFTEWLRGCGFEAQRPLYRMCRPGTDAHEPLVGNPRALVEYTIFGPEFA
jgi:GNAT superfamily N-acetyltransferase